MAGKKSNSSKLDMTVLAGSIIAGVVGSIISWMIYRPLADSFWSPLAIGLVFMIFALVFSIIMVIINLVNGNLPRAFAESKSNSPVQVFLLLGAFVLMALLLGTLFEFIYERDFFSAGKGYQESTSYVFIIDNSGSMETSDPTGLRYSAIRDIIADKDGSFPYAVYSFNDAVKEERGLAPVSDGQNDFQTTAEGGTAIRTTLTDLYDHFKGGEMKQLGDSPRFLLLTDGYATDLGMFSSIDKILKKYSKTNITISTVGLGDTDDQLMQQIADATGGVYISVDDVGQLEDSMQQAVSRKADYKYKRTFFTYRNVPRLNGLYAIMRIIFTGLLSCLISLMMLFATGRSKDSDRIILTSAVTAVSAGLILELGINLLSIPPALIRLIYFVLTALTFITQQGVGGRGKGEEYEDPEIDFQAERLDDQDVSGIDGDSDFLGQDGFGNW